MMTHGEDSGTKKHAREDIFGIRPVSVQRSPVAASWMSHGGGRVTGGFAASLLRELRDDLPLHVVIAAYLLSVALACWLVGQSDKFTPLVYASKWLGALPFVGSIAAATILVVGGVVAQPAAPITGLVLILRKANLPRIAAGIILYTSVTMFYGAFPSAKNLLPDIVVFDWDVLLADIDQWLHGGHAPWEILHALFNGYTRAIDVFYGPVWGVMMLLMVMWVAVFEADRLERKRFFWVFIGCWFVLGNLFAVSIFSGGPIFYDRIVGDTGRFRNLLHNLAAYQDPPLGVQVYQAYLWSIHERRQVGFGVGISAFPSMHLSMATLIGLWLSGLHRGLIPLAILFVLFTLLGSVHLAWHYAVDGYASIAFTLVAWWALGTVMRLRRGAIA